MAFNSMALINDTIIVFFRNYYTDVYYYFMTSGNFLCN